MESSASFNNIFSNEPWLTIEEFNVIAHPSKSSNECQEFNSNIRDFIVSRFQIFVFDHAFSGFLFFTQSQVGFLPLGISYHYPAFIQLHQESYSPPKPFKFFNHWTKHSKFLEVVK